MFCKLKFSTQIEFYAEALLLGWLTALLAGLLLTLAVCSVEALMSSSQARW